MLVIDNHKGTINSAEMALLWLYMFHVLIKVSTSRNRSKVYAWVENLLFVFITVLFFMNEIFINNYIFFHIHLFFRYDSFYITIILNRIFGYFINRILIKTELSFCATTCTI